jgi:beta-lactam-binding protein with PASTA domain
VSLLLTLSCAVGCELTIVAADQDAPPRKSKRPAATPRVRPQPKVKPKPETKLKPEPKPPAPVVVEPEAPKEVKVPRVRNRTLAQARGKIESAGLKVGKVTEGVGHFMIDLGKVLKTTPGPSTVVMSGTKVDIEVKGAPEKASDGSPAIPHMWGMKLEEARKVLQGLGIQRIAVKEWESASVPAGTVINHEPGAGESSRRFRNREFKIKVAKRPMDADVPKDARLPVPNVVGKTWTEAYPILRKAGGWRMKQRGERLTRDSRIIGQEPSAGAKHTTFRKVVVIFPEAPMITVPNVVGMTEREARNALRQAGFSTSGMRFSDKKVKSQTPRGGAKAKRGSPVRVVLER